jgi:hypothetical protein
VISEKEFSFCLLSRGVFRVAAEVGYITGQVLCVDGGVVM